MDYIVNLLKKTLQKEKTNQDFWLKNINSTDPLLRQQANGNIHSNEIRVNELEEALEIIQIHKKVTQQRNWRVIGTLIEITPEGQKMVDKANKPKQQQFKKQH